VGHGTGLWHEQVHMPLVLRTPGQSEPVMADALAGHVDIAPTVLQALGMETPGHLPGRSLLEPSDPLRPLLLQHWTGRWGIQIGPWKMQRRPADEKLSHSHVAREKELVPHEHPILHRLLRMHLAWSYAGLGTAASQGEAALDPELAEQLEKLGYIVK
jgi:hypothetical protein